MHSNYKKAQAAPRCQYIRMNDQPCTQPALQDQIFCRFHEGLEHPLPAALIPFVEDATSLQTALMQVIRGLQTGRIDRRIAGTILYALQLASSNLKHFCEESGHPFAESPRKPKKQQQEEQEEEGESLVDYLIKQLQLEPPPDQVGNELERQAPPISRSRDAQISRSPDSPRPASPALKDRQPTDGLIDDLKACDETKSRSLKPAARLRISPTLADFPWDAWDNREGGSQLRT